MQKKTMTEENIGPNSLHSQFGDVGQLTSFLYELEKRAFMYLYNIKIVVTSKGHCAI